MLRRAGALALLVVAVVACGGDSFDGTWRLVSFEVDGEPFQTEGALYLEITDDGLAADTTCNGASGPLGGPLATTLMMCADESAMTGESYMTQALASEPVEIDGRLVFVEGDVRLIYEPFTDPSATDLIAVLDDERRSVDPSVLPPESVTGSVPPDVEALIPVTSPSPDVDLFLGLIDGRPCIVFATATSVDASCTGPRDLVVGTTAVNIPAVEPDAFRVAIIPDAFADAVARSGLGTYETNLLVVAAEVPAGRQVITNSAQNTLTIAIAEPMGGPTTVPPTTVTTP